MKTRTENLVIHAAILGAVLYCAGIAYTAVLGVESIASRIAIQRAAVAAMQEAAR